MFNEAQLAQMMKPVPHFAGLEEADLVAIIRSGSLLDYASEDTFFWESDPCAGLFVLLRGQVHLYKHGPEGQENIMGVIEPISMFNEVAVLDGGDNPATARAFTSCTVWRAAREDFQTLMEDYPQIARGLLPILARRNRWLISQYEDMCFLPVRARTAKLLLALSQNGTLEVDRSKYSIQELAARISTSPEVVSRTLGLLSSRGFIKSSRQTLSVVNAAALSKMALVEMDSIFESS